MTVTMISENIKRIKEKITNAALKAKRSPEDIKLVAVSKRFPADKIIDAIAAGQKIFGENYIQEVQEKRNLVPPQTNFHFIGHLQSNKAKIAAETCSMIETVDRLKLGNVLNKHLQSLDKTMDVLIQVNIGNDQNKAGLERSKTEELLIQLNEMSNLRVCGLMTMPPLTDNPELTRPHFRKLRLLAEELVAKDLFQALEKPELSMGMSEDFHIAIEEGATIVRVGTAIFGQRLYTNK
jgi:pyridoxal phosphate enzyme (YggS family)